MKCEGSTFCASYDLAPIFELALDVVWDRAKEKALAVPYVGAAGVGGLSFRFKDMVSKRSQMFVKYCRTTMRTDWLLVVSFFPAESITGLRLTNNS